NATTKEKETNDEDGIQFFKGTWEEALEEALSTNKPIFLDAYTSWCGPCHWMSNNIFTDEQVAEFYNKNFINFKQDMEKGIGPQLTSYYHVSAYPTLLFIDGKGRQILSSEGSKKVDPFIKLGEKALVDFKLGEYYDDKSYQVERNSIEIDAEYIGNRGSRVVEIVFKKGYNGINYLAMHAGANSHIIKINDDGEKVGEELAMFEEFVIKDILPLKDGSLLIAAGKVPPAPRKYVYITPEILYFIKLSPEGKVIKQTKIIGQFEGEYRKKWFQAHSNVEIKSNGSQIAMFFTIHENYSKPDEKETEYISDAFVLLDLKGNLLSEVQTGLQYAEAKVAMTMDDKGNFYTMTMNNSSYVYGLTLMDRRKKEYKIPPVWPPASEKPESDAINARYYGPGLLQYASYHKGDFVAILSSAEGLNIGHNTNMDPMLLRFDKNGKVLAERTLHVSPEVNDRYVSVHPIGDNFMIASGLGNHYKNKYKPAEFDVMVVDGQGNEVVAPTRIKAPFGTHSKIIALSNKTFIWVDAGRYYKSFDIFKLTLK
ncbi:MAG: DUF255 domain-containing protein, partial [Aureispira sp.]|nr:DUF255 domain-containing protein [Aureispira sp.]